MFLRNHTRAFRPLRGGIHVFNPVANEPGTLGLVATSDGVDRWIVSCYHVLGRPDLSAAVDGEPIFQPAPGADASGQAVARLDMSRCDRNRDFAAAKCVPGILAVGEILALGRLGRPVQPVINMPVVKSGIATGVTEGTIHSIAGDALTIAVRGDFPNDYELTVAGDSGAAWLEKATFAPVALNIGLGPPGSRLATAVSLGGLLAAAGLAIP